MTYISGTITDANPGAAWYAVIAPALTSAGYTLVDTVVVSTRTHKIWQSAAASNSQNKDWYLDVAYTTTGSGTLGFFVSEGYNATTDKYIRPTFNGASSVIEATFYSRWGATEVALEDANQQPRAGGGSANDLSITSTAFGYWMSITTNRVAVGFSGDPTALQYHGLWNPLEPYKTKVGAAVYPLLSGKFTPGDIRHVQSGASPTLAVARSPLRTAALVGNNWNINTLTEPLELMWIPNIPAGTSVYQDRQAGPVYIRTNQYGSDTPTGIMGNLIDIMVVPATGTVRGDTLTVSGIAEPFFLTTAANNSIDASPRALMMRTN